MKRFALFMTLFAVLLLASSSVLAQNSNLFDWRGGTNGGANRFWVTDDCDYMMSGQAVRGRPSYDNVGDWLNEAARVFGGTTHSTGNISGNSVPNIFNVNDNGRVTLSGRGVGGSYKWDFASREAGQNFLNFLLDVRNDDSNLFLTNCGLPGPEDFDHSTGTNGGANRFYIENGQFKVWGHSVSGIFATTDVIAWVQEAARLYDCDVVRTGNFNYNTTPNIRRASPNGRAVLGGRGVGGSFVWQCDNQGEAQNFVNFLNLIAREGLFEFDVTTAD